MSKETFSKLKKQVESLFDPALKMQLCNSRNSPLRYYVKLGGEIIWDCPVHDLGIEDLIKAYIDAPVRGLLEKEFEGENGLADLFKAADRRIGKRRLVEFSVMLTNYTAIKIIVRRLYPDEYAG